MFSINRGKGFSIEFPNGLTLSTQFGYGNYCDNYQATFSDEQVLYDVVVCKNAEIAILYNGDFITNELLNNGQEVQGWVDMNRWHEIYDICKNWKNDSKKGEK